MPTNDTPIEYTENENVLENTESDAEVLEVLQTQVEEKLEQVEAATDRKVTIDSITKNVPSTGLNTTARNELEAQLADQHRLRMRHLGF
jgi:hypothetical protein